MPVTCQEICGDGWTTVYPCDNAFNIAYDGCDNNCLIMSNFVCQITPNQATICSYTGVLDMQLVSFVSKKYNAFEMKIHIFPPLYAFHLTPSSEFSKIFAIDNSNFDVTSVVYNEAESTILFVGEMKDIILSDDSI